MNHDDIARAKAAVLRCPTRPRWRDDTTIIVRCHDLEAADRPIVRLLARELRADVRAATVCELRESEPSPLIGDVELEFRIEALL